MKTISYLSLVCIVLFSTHAIAETTCVKKRVPVRNGRVNLGGAIAVRDGNCSANENQIGSSVGVIDGLARLSSGGSTINFSGRNVSSVLATQSVVPGLYNITFTGDFSGRLSGADSDSNRAKVTTFGAVVGGERLVSLPFVVSASETEIGLAVNIYNTAGVMEHLANGEEFSVMFLISE